MRDIREDLRQRLVKISAQRAEFQARLRWLDEMEEHIKAALEYERAHSELDVDQVSLFPEIAPEGERTATAKFIRDALSDLQPKTLDELKAAAERRGLIFGNKNPGRVLHFALVGMKQGGIVDRDHEGRWWLKETDSAM